MGKNNRFLFAALLLLTTATAGLSGCGNGNPPAPTTQNARVQVQNTTPGRGGQNNANSNTTASHLETLARSVNGVQDANCVVFGRYAIVGLDVEPTMDRSRVGTTKYAVAQALRKDPRGANALVTADIDLAQRIREIRTDVQNGRPIIGFTEELADMVGRLIPQVPRNVVPPPEPNDVGGKPNAQNGRR